MFGLNTDSYGDEDCEEIYEGPYNCTEEAREDIEDVKFCEYWAVYDCWGMESCHSKIKVGNDTFEGDCYEMMDMFGIYSDNDDEDWYYDDEDWYTDNDHMSEDDEHMTGDDEHHHTGDDEDHRPSDEDNMTGDDEHMTGDDEHMTGDDEPHHTGDDEDHRPSDEDNMTGDDEHHETGDDNDWYHDDECWGEDHGPF
jgi:hypothetical protein